MAFLSLFFFIHFVLPRYFSKPNLGQVEIAFSPSPISDLSNPIHLLADSSSLVKCEGWVQDIYKEKQENCKSNLQIFLDFFIQNQILTIIISLSFFMIFPL